MGTSTDKRKKVILHFLLGIGLPSLLLGYLAFRGVRNDIALIERERLNRHQARAQVITDSFDKKLSQLEAAFSDAAVNIPHSLDDANEPQSLQGLKGRERFIEAVFFVDNSENIELPFARPLYCLESRHDEPSQQIHLSALVEGERYEFQERRYPEALAAYQQAFAYVSAPEFIGEVLNAIARVQRKLNLFQDAIESYQTMARDYSHMQTAGHTPLGVIARLEIADAHVAVDDCDSAVQTLIYLYRDLIQGEWLLEKAQYEYIVQQVKASINKILSTYSELETYNKTLSALKIEEVKQRELTDRLLAFQADAAPYLQITRSPGADGLQKAILRHRKPMYV